MNYAQSFEEFSKGLNGTDLALYAGIGIILWVLFKDKLSPVQEFIMNITKKTNKSASTVAYNDVVPTFKSISTNSIPKDEIFFELVASWKKTRDLAIKSECVRAVEVIDQMFPYLSPKICGEKKTNEI